MAENNAINKQTEDLYINKAAGDPFIKYAIASGDKFSLGVDDSDSDKFKLTDGADPSSGTEIFTVDPTSSNAITFNAAFEFPAVDGTSGQVLITDGAGTITWQNPLEGLNWVEIIATSVAMQANEGYILNNAALVTATLPATCALGLRVRVAGKGAGGWTIAQNAGQTIHFGNQDTTTGAGGSLSSTNQYDSIDLLCITADTDFLAISSIGNMTVV